MAKLSKRESNAWKDILRILNQGIDNQTFQSDIKPSTSNVIHKFHKGGHLSAPLNPDGIYRDNQYVGRFAAYLSQVWTCDIDPIEQTSIQIPMPGGGYEYEEACSIVFPNECANMSCDWRCYDSNGNFTTDLGICSYDPTPGAGDTDVYCPNYTGPENSKVVECYKPNQAPLNPDSKYECCTNDRECDIMTGLVGIYRCDRTIKCDPSECIECNSNEVNVCPNGMYCQTIGGEAMGCCVQSPDGPHDEFKDGGPTLHDTGIVGNRKEKFKYGHCVAIQSEDPDDVEDDPIEMNECNPVGNNVVGTNADCLAVGGPGPTPYCTSGGQCVECLIDENCFEGDQCIGNECNTMDVQPNICQDYLALNYGSDTIITSSSECYSWFQNTFQETYEGDWEYNSGCCYNHSGQYIEFDFNYGDTNNDGVINVLDVVQLVSCILDGGDTADCFPGNFDFYLPPSCSGDGTPQFEWPDFQTYWNWYWYDPDSPISGNCDEVLLNNVAAWLNTQATCDDSGGTFLEAMCDILPPPSCEELECFDETQCPCYDTGCCNADCTECTTGCDDSCADTCSDMTTGCDDSCSLTCSDMTTGCSDSCGQTCTDVECWSTGGSCCTETCSDMATGCTDSCLLTCSDMSTGCSDSCSQTCMDPSTGCDDSCSETCSDMATGCDDSCSDTCMDPSTGCDDSCSETCMDPSTGCDDSCSETCSDMATGCDDSCSETCSDMSTGCDDSCSLTCSDMSTGCDDSIVDSNGDGYDDISYIAGQQSITVPLWSYIKPAGSVNPSESGLFDFHYPYDSAISIKDIFSHIWLEDPDAYCDANGYASWETCVVDGSDGNTALNMLPSVDADIIYTRMATGHLKSITSNASLGTWTTFTDPYGSEITFGNAPDGDCGVADGTCITKGFIGTIGLQLYDSSNMDYLGCVSYFDGGTCTGSCGGGINLDPYNEGGGRVCECGLRDTLADCNRPYGYLKFKPPIDGWGTV